MKKGTLLMALFALTALLTVSCGGGSDTKDDQSIWKVLAQAVKESLNENDTVAEEEAESTEDMPVRNVEEEKEVRTWLSGNFKIAYESYPYVTMNIMTGAKDNTKTQFTIVKTTDKIYIHGIVPNQAEVYQLACIENGELTLYYINPIKKTAMKQPIEAESLEELARKAVGDVYMIPKNMDELTESGTEDIAGVKCVVYKNNGEKAAEEVEKAQKEAAGWGMLAKALGGDTKGLDAVKEQLSGFSGNSTYWIDPTKDRFIARKHIYIEMNGKITDADTHLVTFFHEGDTYASEIPDISEYTIE